MSTIACLSVADWPAADRAGWARALQPVRLLDTSGAGYAQRWRSTTRRSIEDGYGRWLGWLKQNDWLDLESTAASRASEDRVVEYYDALRDRGLADYTLANRLAQLADALKAIAPDGDWAWIQKGSSRVHAKAQPAKDLRPRMRPPEEILAVALALMQPADDDALRQPVQAAVRFREGLILGLMVHRPLRIGAVSLIDIGGRLTRQGEGWGLEFSAEDMKQKRPYSCSWPDCLVSPLECYLATHRPVLLAGRGRRRAPPEALWVSYTGSAMKTESLAQSIELRTKAEFGLAINPHTFRHIAATTLATDRPESVTDIMGLLSHATLEVSEKHYNLAKATAAGRTYQQLIKGHRARGFSPATD